MSELVWARSEMIDGERVTGAKDSDKGGSGGSGLC